MCVISVTPCACTLTLARWVEQREVRGEGNEKETTRERERETGRRGGGTERIAFTQCSFLPPPERESPSTRHDSNSLVATTGETDRGKERRSARTRRGNGRDDERERERETRSEATRAGRVYVEEAENSLFERPSAHSNHTQASVYAGRDRERERRGRGEGGG